jgi:GNAT superfamily N-acetyltransferase
MPIIKPATSADAHLMPDIERSSGEAFRQIPGLEWIADDGVTSAERHKALIRQGAVWVAEDDDGSIVGFLSAEVHQSALHVWQMSVHADQQGKGIGRRLINEAVTWASTHPLNALTLTTFRDVPWNAPFYRSCGCEIVDPALYPMLQATLEAEGLAGLPMELRCAMMLRL